MALADYIDRKPNIDTPRLRLRPMTAADVPALTEWMPDRSIYTYWGKGPSKCDKNPKLMFEKAEKPSKSFYLGIEERESGKIIGDLWVYLIENDRMATVAIRIASASQGKGCGTEALSAMTRFCFTHTELQRLWAKVDARNIPSQRMLDKCGYQREGLIRQGKMVNSWCDYYIYAILAEDLRTAVDRVTKMETLFDMLTYAVRKLPELTDDHRQAAKTLSDYLDGEWKFDYRLDESGMLPSDLKRGVLSQDGLYNLLTDIES